MSTLEIRQLYDFEFVHWPHESPQQVRDRLYPTDNLRPCNVAPIANSLAAGPTYRQGFHLDKHVYVTLVEVPG